MLSPETQNTDISTGPWFGLRLFPCVKGSYFRLDNKGQGLVFATRNTKTQHNSDPDTDHVQQRGCEVWDVR